MDRFNIRNYMWNILEICHSNKLVSVNASYEMFMENVKLGYARYKGADIDYALLKKMYDRESDFYHKMQDMIYRSIMDKNFNKISRAWVKHDREGVELASNLLVPILGIKLREKR